MKKVLSLLLVFFVFSGCGTQNRTEESFFHIRQNLQKHSAKLRCHITADFGETTYQFSLACIFDTAGDMTFEVQSPETISGITGKIVSSGGSLTFEDKSVAFSLLADGEITPISAPWLLFRGLRGGYLVSWASQADGIRLTVDDTFNGSQVQTVSLWSRDMVPVFAEIFWNGKCLLSVTVEEFRYL